MALFSSVLCAMADAYGLDAGFNEFATGFDDAGLVEIPNFVRQLEPPFETYSSFILSKLSSSRHYWAPEIRFELMAMHAVPHIRNLIRLVNIEMSKQLERLVASGMWTNDEAVTFATQKAGKLLLCLYGNFR